MLKLPLIDILQSRQGYFIRESCGFWCSFSFYGSNKINDNSIMAAASAHDVKFIFKIQNTPVRSILCTGCGTWNTYLGTYNNFKDQKLVGLLNLK